EIDIQLSTAPGGRADEREIDRQRHAGIRAGDIDGFGECARDAVRNEDHEVEIIHGSAVRARPEAEVRRRVRYRRYRSVVGAGWGWRRAEPVPRSCDGMRRQKSDDRTDAGNDRRRKEL